jgi:predicted peptidase
MALIAAGALAMQPPAGGGRPPGMRGGPGNQGFGGQRPEQAPARLHPGIELRSYVFEPTGEKLSYAVFVPRRLDRSKPVPLVIALHAAGAAPAAILSPLAAAAEKGGYILAAPSGYAPTGWYGFVRRMAGRAERETSRLSEIDVMNVMGIVRNEFNIDPQRIYVVGASMGGVGAVYLATKYRDQWAAVGVISPAITTNTPAEFEGYDAAPVIVLHGDRDEGVPVKLVRDWVAGLRQREVPVQYVEYRGGTHTSVVQQSGERVMEFFDVHSRVEPSAPE